MTESKRQKQVSGLINEVMNTIFLKMGLNMYKGGMVSFSHVKISPDLYEAKIYLSLFKVEKQDEFLIHINEKMGEIRKELGNSLRHQLRSIPILKFYLDDTLEYAENMQNLFKKIEADDLALKESLKKNEK